MPTVGKLQGLRPIYENCTPAAIAVMALCSCASGQGRVPEIVEARLAAALAPDSSQRVVFFPVQRASALPGASFYRARLDPPIRNGEDSSPTFAAIVAVRDSLVLLVSVRDLPAAWALIHPPVPSTPADVVRLVEHLGDLSGTLRRSDLLSSAAEARAAFGPDARFDDAAALDSIAPPSAALVNGFWQVRFFVRSRSHIQRVQFDVKDYLLTVEITATAWTDLSM